MAVCKHLHIEPNKDAKRMMPSDRTYVCRVDVPQPVLPASITGAFDFKWPPSRSYVTKDMCAKCPLFDQDTSKEKRERK